MAYCNALPLLSLIICAVLVPFSGAAGPQGESKTAPPIFKFALEQNPDPSALSPRKQNNNLEAPSNGRGTTEVKPSTSLPTITDDGPIHGARNPVGGDGKLPSAKQNGCPDWNQCSFVEHFNKKTDRWIAADGYANGNPFDAWWSKGKTVIDLGAKKLKLSIGNNPNFGKPYAAGQLQSTRWHGYGCYEVRMKPVFQQGLISTFFTYTGKYDAAPGAQKAHNEVDIEFVYRQSAGKLLMQANYFTNGKGGNEHYIDLPFRPEQSFHNYAFRWTSKKIEWFVDGKKVHTAFKNLPKASTSHHKIMMNFWPVSHVAGSWGGWFNYQGPRTVLYDAVRFTKGEKCSIKNSFATSKR